MATVRPSNPAKSHDRMVKQQVDDGWVLEVYQVLSPRDGIDLRPIYTISVLFVGLPLMFVGVMVLIIVGVARLASLLELGMTARSVLVYGTAVAALVWMVRGLRRTWLSIWSRSSGHGDWLQMHLTPEALEVQADVQASPTQTGVFHRVTRRWSLLDLQTPQGPAVQLTGMPDAPEIVINPGPQPLRLRGMQCTSQDIEALFEFLRGAVIEAVHRQGKGSEEVPDVLEQLQSNATDMDSV